MSGLERVTWEPTRAAGLERLALFAPHAGQHYGAQRNYDRGPEDRSNTSCLSPWIRHRLITEDEVLRATLKAHEPGAAQSFIQEVFWRGYFKGWLQHRPQVWTSYQDDVDILDNRIQFDETLRRDHEAACRGVTGIECFDGWVGELIETGYLHNHARMWFASIWIFTLRLPWQLGADFFLRHLLDGDAASNTLSWRWVGGLHTIGKTYLATAENITRFTEGRFGDAAELSRQLATEAQALEETVDLGTVPLALLDCQRPEGRFGLVLTEDDLWGTPIPAPGTPVAVIANDLSAFRAGDAASPQVSRFAKLALTDALERLGSHFDCPVAQGDTAQFGDLLVGWSRENHISSLVMAAPPIGHVAEFVARDVPKLDAAGIDLTFLSREYDRACWPHATRGFFKMKKKIPDFLSDLNLAGSRSTCS